MTVSSRVLRRIRISGVIASMIAMLTPAAVHAALGPNVAPRPLSQAERAAVQYAVAFLDQGPSALWPALAAKSPWRALGQSAALGEIEARTGPSTGAVWTLQTVVPSLKDRTAVFDVSFASGIDETLAMNLVPEGGTYKIDTIRISAERSLAPPSIRQSTPKAMQPAEAKGGSSTILLALGLIAGLIGIGAAALRRYTPPLARGFAVASAALLAASLLLLFHSDERFHLTTSQSKHASGNDDGNLNLGSLVALRRELALGKSDIRQSMSKLPDSPAARSVALLWKAQWDLQQMNMENVEKTLATFPSPSDVPLVEILRGRLAFFRSKEVDAALAYQHAINLGPGRDGLWLEAFDVLNTLGFEEQARQYLDRTARIGSRRSDVYYALSSYAANENKTYDSEVFLETAWHLKPVKREQLVEASTLYETLRVPEVATLVDLSSAAEASFAAPDLASNPVTIPANAQALVSGDYLEVHEGDSKLIVPKGAAIAPAGAQVVDAAALEKMEEKSAIDDLPQLRSLAQNAASIAQPAIRRRVERSANALLNHNRWDDLLALTASLSPQAENVPIEVLFSRSLALRHVQRLGDAKTLLAGIAVSPVLKRKTDPQTLMELGEMLASVDLYEPAVKIMERAGSVRDIPYLDDRIRQLLTDERLATSAATYRTDHFEIHYPQDGDQTTIKKIGEILEAEEKRLTRWIPLTNPVPVTVNVIEWQQFRSTYTGDDYTLGFYNGKITVPLAEVGEFSPEVVAILSHELAHAMIAQLTNDQSPQWFQEGLAKRIEPVKYAANALNMYDDNKLFSVAVLDSVFRGSPDPNVIGEAYIESSSLIRYIEAEYGVAGLVKIMNSFRAGADTEEAIEQLCGQTLPDFDRHFREWGRAGTKVFINDDVARYDVIDDHSIEFGRDREKRQHNQ